MAEYTDAELNKLVFKAIVPKGLRPETPEEIEAMLDTIGGESPSDDTVERMLRKIRGEESLGEPQEKAENIWTNESTEEPSASELALYRNRNDEIPPEIQKQLQELEEEALEDSEDDKDVNEPGSQNE